MVHGNSIPDEEWREFIGIVCDYCKEDIPSIANIAYSLGTAVLESYQVCKLMFQIKKNIRL